MRNAKRVKDRNELLNRFKLDQQFDIPKVNLKCAEGAPGGEISAEVARKNCEKKIAEVARKSTNVEVTFDRKSDTDINQAETNISYDNFIEERNLESGLLFNEERSRLRPRKNVNYKL